jgi:hypothetical protein
MKTNKEVPFGYEYSTKFQAGDLVEWSGWGYSEDGEVIHNRNFGIIISIESEFFNGRDVVFAKVLPAGEEETKKFIVMILRKTNKK